MYVPFDSYNHQLRVMAVASASNMHFTLYLVWQESIFLEKWKFFFWKIPFLPDMNFKAHERQKVAKQVINPTSHPDSSTFPRRRKIALKLLLCNLFHTCMKLIVAAVCLFLEPAFSKGKSKKCRPGMGKSSPLLPFDITHINLTFDM